jgi:hypothetical protein
MVSVFCDIFFIFVIILHSLFALVLF